MTMRKITGYEVNLKIKGIWYSKRFATLEKARKYFDSKEYAGYITPLYSFVN